MLYSFDLLPEARKISSVSVHCRNITSRKFCVERAKDFPHVDIRWSSRVIGVKNGDNTALLNVETPQGNYESKPTG